MSRRGSAGPWVRLNAQRDLRNNLRAAIKEAGLSQAVAARESEVKYSRLIGGLNGNSWFTSEDVDRLAGLLEISADELLGASIFYEDRARWKEFAHEPIEIAHYRQHPSQRSVNVPTPTEGRERAICCTCGAIRTYSVKTVTVYDESRDVGLVASGGRRRAQEMKCEICQAVTSHALLLPKADLRDSAEQRDHAPTREAAAAKELQQLISRISGFGVDVHFHARGKKTRAKGFVSLYEYDESKSRWRIELDPNAPSRINVGQLAYMWKRIATNDHGDIDWNPEDGVVIAPSSTDWESATDELMDDVTRFLSVERHRMVADLNDQLSAQSATAGTSPDNDQETWA